MTIWNIFQVEMTGSSIFDYVHQSDHQELSEQLGVTLAHQQKVNSGGHSAKVLSESDLLKGGQSQQQQTGASPAIPDGKPCK